MRIGILGGTGPAGSALGLRLASIGCDVLLGSRNSQRAVDISAELSRKWPNFKLNLNGGDNDAAANCEIVIIATPWDSAATIVNEHT